MKYLLLVLVLIPNLLLSNPDTKSYAVHNIPPNLLQDANAVIRNYEETFHVHDPGSATWTVKAAITRLNSNADHEFIGVNYDAYSKVRSLSAALYDANGNLIRKIKKNEIKDVGAVSSFSIYEDDRIKYVDGSYGVYPYTIEYEYEVVMNSIMRYPNWQVQSYQTSVESSSYHLIIPDHIEVQAKLHQLDIAPEESTVEDKERSKRWQIKNLPAKTAQKNTPERAKQLACAYFIPNKFEVDGYEGDMSSWEAYGKFMYHLNYGRDELSPSMAAKVHELTDHLDSDRAKINALYKYLQQNMRYVSVQLGIGGWQTFTAQYVEKNKYGDCKALSNFMKAMLKEVGIEAYAVLIYSARNLPYEVSSDFSYPKFNHAIVHVPQEDYWLECTSQEYPPNYIGRSNADRNVLLITPEGGKLVRTPKLTLATNQQISTTTIALSPSGQAKIKNAVTYTGALQDYYRYQTKNYDDKKLKELFLENNDLPMSQIETLKMRIVEDQPTVNVNYELTIPRYAAKGGKRLFIPFNTLNRFDYIPSKTEERIYPINRGLAFTDLDTIVIDLPELAIVETMPKATTIESDFGTYTLEVETKEGQLLYIRKLVLYQMIIPTERYEEWRTFCQAVAKKDKGKVIIKMSQA